MSKFGIFKSEVKIKERSFLKRSLPSRSWDMVSSDDYIGDPVEVFDELCDAIAKLYRDSNYEPICKTYSDCGIRYTDYTVYFVEEIESGIGWAIRGIFYNESGEGYEPKMPKITNVKFIINGDTEYPYSGVKVEFPEQGNVYDGDVYYIDDVDAEEIENLCVFSTNKMNLEAIKEQFDLIVDGARDKITEI